MPAKLDRCVRQVRASGSARNPYATCNSALRRPKRRAKRRVRRRRVRRPVIRMPRMPRRRRIIRRKR